MTFCWGTNGSKPPVKCRCEVMVQSEKVVIRCTTAKLVSLEKWRLRMWSSGCQKFTQNTQHISRMLSRPPKQHPSQKQRRKNFFAAPDETPAVRNPEIKNARSCIHHREAHLRHDDMSWPSDLKRLGSEQLVRKSTARVHGDAAPCNCVSNGAEYQENGEAINDSTRSFVRCANW